MKAFTLAAVTTGALACAALGFTGTATAAPSGPSNVDDTVRSLEGKGYNVIVNREGATPLSQCSVAAVRPGQTHSTTDSRGGGSLNTTVTSETVFVDVAC
jgi:hypothetical protein